MFKNSYITKMDAWKIVEESDALPVLSYPAFVGTGKLGIGLDAAGLQSLPEVMGEQFNSFARPFHITQADLYILRAGMISTHLFDDEIAFTDTKPSEMDWPRDFQRNFMPLGYLDQIWEYEGEEMAKGSFAVHRRRWRVTKGEIRHHVRAWRREWSLLTGIVRTSYEIGMHRRFRLELEVFAPFGTESVYVKLTREAHPDNIDGRFDWTVSLPLMTRHNVDIYDKNSTIKIGRHGLLARIDETSKYKPAEPYAVVYGIVADGAEATLTPEGWTVKMSGPLAQPQTCYLRMDFKRHAGPEVKSAPACLQEIDQELDHFDDRYYQKAFQDHIKDWRHFWNETADIEVESADAFDIRRRFILHISEYLLRCGNEYSFGGTVQFLLLHMNGWTASNFHDNHYIGDGLARANIFKEALDNVHWLRRVMKPTGRAFPWKITYDGKSAVPPEQDIAPMSDTNRALLAMRIYELCGLHRIQFLRETVYPIVSRVADMAVSDWFVERNGEWFLKKVCCDTVDSSGDPEEHELGTVCSFITLLRKAADYSELLGVDDTRRQQWREFADKIPLPMVENKYMAANDWFYIGYYISEAGDYLNADVYQRTIDSLGPRMSCNYPWMNSAAACAEIRLNRPDRAEQLMLDSLSQRLHGPGYFEEVTPIGTYALPPFATAHGAYVTACCEQIVLSDFWHKRIYIGRGLPSSMRSRFLLFSNLRAIGGLIVSGKLTPTSLMVKLVHTGDPLEIEAHLQLPGRIGVCFEVLCDGRLVEYAFHGETVSVPVSLNTSQELTLEVRS